MSRGDKSAIWELGIMKVNRNRNRIRHKKRIQNQHKSLRRMAFYAEEHANDTKPFRCYKDRGNKVIGN